MYIPYERLSRHPMTCILWNSSRLIRFVDEEVYLLTEYTISFVSVFKIWIKFIINRKAFSRLAESPTQFIWQDAETTAWIEHDGEIKKKLGVESLQIISIDSTTNLRSQYFPNL